MVEASLVKSKQVPLVHAYRQHVCARCKCEGGNTRARSGLQDGRIDVHTESAVTSPDLLVTPGAAAACPWPDVAPARPGAARLPPDRAAAAAAGASTFAWQSQCTRPTHPSCT